MEQKKVYLAKIEVDGEEFLVRCWLSDIEQDGGVLVVESEQFKMVFHFDDEEGFEIKYSLGPHVVELREPYGEREEYQSLLEKAYDVGEMLPRQEIIDWLLES